MNLLAGDRTFRHLIVILLLLASLFSAVLGYSTRSSEKEGALVVSVTYGDLDNTPADTAYVEASGTMSTDGSRKSFILKQPLPGRYETSLPPGIYDIFVSEGTSEPACRRMQIAPGATNTWSVKLKMDEQYLQN